MLSVGFEAKAENPETPATVSFAKVYTAEEAKAQQDAGALIVDARPTHEYAFAHIKGAVSAPADNVKVGTVINEGDDVSYIALDETKLGTDKSKEVIFYCNGIKCWQSYAALYIAHKHGFANIGWLRTGLPAWKEKGLPIE